MATLEIQSIERGELVAPCGIWFEAINLSGFEPTGPATGEVYDPTFHDITYFWDFDDVGDFPNGPNIPDAWNDRNVAYGKKTAHVFNRPGSYNVSVLAVDRAGNWGTATHTVVINDPNTLYAGARTICYSEAGDFAGAPVGAQQVTTSSALMSSLANLTQTARVMFKAGSDHTMTMVFNTSTYDQNLRFEAWGTGAKPILRSDRSVGNFIFGVGDETTANDFRFIGIELRGGWDPDTETGRWDDQPVNILLCTAPGFSLVFHDCLITGMEAIYPYTLKPVGYSIFFSETTVERWANYGAFVGVQADGIQPDVYLAVIGSEFKQSPDACRGTEGKPAMSNQHGPLRFTTQRNSLIRSSYFFSNTSWGFGAQPCIRALANNPGDTFLVADRFVCEGGSTIFGIDGQNAAQPDLPGNFVVDKGLLVGASFTEKFIGLGYGGATIRNVLMYQPDIPNLMAPGAPAIHYLANTSTGSNLTTPISIYNVTLLNDLSAANNPQPNDIGFIDPLFANFVNYDDANNIHHAPNQASPVTISDPLDLSGVVAGFTPRNSGVRFSLNRPQIMSLPSSIPPGATISFPYPTVNDGNNTPTGSSDYAAGGRHFIGRSTDGGDDANRYHQRDAGEISISFGASDVTVTNTSGETWNAGERMWLGLDYLGHTTNAAYSTGGMPVPLPRPGPTSEAHETALGYVAADDFLGALRQGSPVPGSPSGDPAKGATEAL